MTLRVISCGGGVQSSWLLALAARRDPAFEQVMGGRVTHAVFANVGDDSEDPAALAWIRGVLAPFAEAHGVELVEVAPAGPTLLEHLLDGPDMIPVIPMRMAGGRPGRRICTQRWKAEVVQRWLRGHGATVDDPAVVAVGISTDEVQRAHNRPGEPFERRVYPLLDLGASRADCQAGNVATFGRPAPRSSCWFCPFHSIGAWAEMRRDDSVLFDKAQHVEDVVNARQDRTGSSPVFLTRRGAVEGRRLSDVVAPAQDALFALDPEFCDDGYCHT